MAKEQRGGVFTLGDVGERQETGSWNTASDVWLIGSPLTPAIFNSNLFLYMF